MGLLDLGALGVGLSEQDERRQNRQEADLATTTKRINLTNDATRRAAAVTDAARVTADANRRQQLEILGGVDSQIEKAKTAIALSNSKDPMDRVKLWMLQQSDKSYTRAGNLERIQYFQSAAGALGDQAVLEQAGFADSVSAIEQELNLSLMEDQGDLELLKLQETQGAELINAMVENQAIKLGQMQTNQAMQEVALADQDRAALEVAAEQAKKTGTANISGIEVSAVDIDRSLAAVKDREFLIATREREAGELALLDATPEQLIEYEAQAKNSKDGRVQVGGTSVSLGRIQDRKHAIAQRDHATLSMEENERQIMENRRREIDQRIINTMPTPKLNQLIMAGGKSEGENGYQYDMDQLVSARDVKASTQASVLQQDMALASVGNPGELAVNHTGYLNSIKAAPGSPLSQIVETQRAATNIAANFVMSDDPMERLMGIQALQGSREAVDTAVAGEAKRLAAGDKDLELALNFQLRGQVIPAQIVQDAIVERASKGQPIGQWLSPQNRGMFTTIYQSELTRLKMSQEGALLDSKTQQQMAADTAIQQVMNVATAGVTDELFAMQFDAQGNPLKGIIQPTTLLTLTRKADENGARQYQQATGMSEEELQKRVNGTVNDPNLAAAQTAQLYLELEKIKPGLGNSYVEWWGTTAPREMTADYIAAKGSTFSDMSQLSEFSLVAPLLQDAMTQNGVLLDAGRNVMHEQQLSREHANYVTFGGSPEAKQVYLLEQTQDLSSIEKQQAFALILKPLISQATTEKLNQQQASTWIEQQLRTMRPQDPLARKLLDKMMKGRDASLKIVDDFIKIQTQRSRPFGSVGAYGAGPAVDYMQTEQFNKQATGFDWYRELQGN